MQIVDLWDQYSNLTWSDIPESTQQIARQCLMDWLACTLAGSKEPLAEILHQEYASQSGICSVVGSDLKLPAQVAAFINGCEGHALDFDDTSTVMGGHPSAPVIPAVLAEAEERECTGQDVLAAIVVGIEIESRLGILIGAEHYARGWHVTSTMGVFGAAAGVAHLLKLDKAEFGNAMGLAASQASGLKSNFGTMTKPFHAGHAAERGLLSARLASRGFTSNQNSFSSNQGLSSAASTGELSEERYNHYKNQWLTEHVLFKYHAACYLTHASIECLLQLGNATDPASCESVTVTVNPSLLDVCGIENPISGLETKFSLRATSALALLGYDTTNPETYADNLFVDDKVNQMIDRVVIRTDEELKTTQSQVRVTASDGSTHEAFYDTGIPATDLNEQQQKLELKFQNLTATAQYPDVLIDRVRSFEMLANIRHWLD